LMITLISRKIMGGGVYKIMRHIHCITENCNKINVKYFTGIVTSCRLSYCCIFPEFASE
jgi:hypothetical protein